MKQVLFRMGIAAQLIWSISGHAEPRDVFVARPDCPALFDLSDESGPQEFHLKIGESMTLHYRTGESFFATFLGKSSTSGLYFYDQKSKSVIFGDLGNFEEVLTPKDLESTRLANATAEMIPEIYEQQASDCAAYSVFHALLILDRQGLVPNPSLDQRLDRTPLQVLEQLRAMKINSENVPRFWNRVFDAFKGLLQHKHFDMLKPSEIQIGAMIRFFSEAGISATTTYSFDRLKYEMMSGMPVILNLFFDTESSYFHRVGAVARPGNYTTVKRPVPWQNGMLSSHSIVARAWIADGTPYGKFLVYDSAPASFYLIDGLDLANALPRSLGALVLHPNSNAVEAPKPN